MRSNKTSKKILKKSYNVHTSSRFGTFSKDTLSLYAFNVVTPYEINPPTQIGSTSANPRNVKAASMRT